MHIILVEDVSRHYVRPALGEGNVPARVYREELVSPLAVAPTIRTVAAFQSAMHRLRPWMRTSATWLSFLVASEVVGTLGAVYWPVRSWLKKKHWRENSICHMCLFGCVATTRLHVDLGACAPPAARINFDIKPSWSRSSSRIKFGFSTTLSVRP